MVAQDNKGHQPLFAALRHGEGVDQIVDEIARIGGLPLPKAA